jgi:hypothetical protein
MLTHGPIPAEAIEALQRKYSEAYQQAIHANFFGYILDNRRRSRKISHFYGLLHSLKERKKLLADIKLAIGGEEDPSSGQPEGLFRLLKKIHNTSQACERFRQYNIEMAHELTPWAEFKMDIEGRMPIEKHLDDLLSFSYGLRYFKPVSFRSEHEEMLYKDTLDLIQDLYDNLNLYSIMYRDSPHKILDLLRSQDQEFNLYCCQLKELMEAKRKFETHPLEKSPWLGGKFFGKPKFSRNTKQIQIEELVARSHPKSSSCTLM